jgi:threonine/homoserine/homoserine lactone efflux protein
MTDPLQFFLAVLLLLAVPGPTNTVMATAGATNRGEPPWLFMVAELAGYLSIIALARLIVLPLTESFPAVGTELKLIVVAYLLYAAFRLWRTRLVLDRTSDRISPRLIYVTTFLNPKGLVFALSIIPKSDPLLWAYFAGFAALVLAVGGTWFMGGRALAVLSGPRASLLPRLGALALTGFAAYLASTIAG